MRLLTEIPTPPDLTRTAARLLARTALIAFIGGIVLLMFSWILPHLWLSQVTLQLMGGWAVLAAPVLAVLSSFQLITVPAGQFYVVFDWRGNVVRYLERGVYWIKPHQDALPFWQKKLRWLDAATISNLSTQQWHTFYLKGRFSINFDPTRAHPDVYDQLLHDGTLETLENKVYAIISDATNQAIRNLSDFELQEARTEERIKRAIRRNFLRPRHGFTSPDDLANGEVDEPATAPPPPVRSVGQWWHLLGGLLHRDQATGDINNYPNAYGLELHDLNVKPQFNDTVMNAINQRLAAEYDTQARLLESQHHLHNIQEHGQRYKDAVEISKTRTHNVRNVNYNHSTQRDDQSKAPLPDETESKPVQRIRPPQDAPSHPPRRRHHGPRDIS